jgi:hypothetical protein
MLQTTLLLQFIIIIIATISLTLILSKSCYLTQS